MFTTIMIIIIITDIIISVGGEIFRTRPDRPWNLPSFLDNRYRISIQGVKRMRRGVDHLLLSSAELKEKVELCLYSPTGLYCMFYSEL